MMTEKFSHNSGRVTRYPFTDDPYPENRAGRPRWFERVLPDLGGLTAGGVPRQQNFKKLLQAIDEHSPSLQKLDDNGLQEKVRHLRVGLYRHGLTDVLVTEAFSIIREAAARTLGMRHFQSQLTGGLVMINGGLAEMDTGEGKTLTASLAAGTAAMAGIPVHVVTSNDYLAGRDAHLLSPLYALLGINVNCVLASMDNTARRKNYASDITYCTNKQLAFDYLRDRILLGSDQGRMRLKLESIHTKTPRIENLFLRGLHFAIVDEADSVLIDDASTPLLISRTVENKGEKALYTEAVAVARELEHTTHYTVDRNRRHVELTDKGEAFLETKSCSMGSVWSGKKRREELMRQAISALYLYRKDHHYLVDQGKVQIIDPNTGRLMPDRSWQRGLHQMIEVKEGCTLTDQKEPLARLSYQKFFSRYRHLAGMTGTASEVRDELRSTYRLDVTAVRPNKPSQRINLGVNMYPTQSAKWQAVITSIKEMRRKGRPVLVGTCSVSASQTLGHLLQAEDIPHRILNARQNAQEAEIIATAGQGGTITVATNMAGRGTDIPLGPGVAEAGGLHVISTEPNDSRRVDRQLYGRCGRQGDPGSYEAILSLDDRLVRDFAKNGLIQHVIGKAAAKMSISNTIGKLLLQAAQRQKETTFRAMRRELLERDEQAGRLLAFSGSAE